MFCKNINIPLLFKFIKFLFNNIKLCISTHAAFLIYNRYTFFISQIFPSPMLTLETRYLTSGSKDDLLGGRLPQLTASQPPGQRTGFPPNLVILPHWPVTVFSNQRTDSLRQKDLGITQNTHKNTTKKTFYWKKKKKKSKFEFQN